MLFPSDKVWCKCNLGTYGNLFLMQAVSSILHLHLKLGLLFWQFANDVVSVDQAKRFYPLFAQMSGLAPVAAGQYMVRYMSTAPDMGSSLHRLTAAVSVSGIMICAFYHLARTYVAKTEPNVLESGGSGKQKKKKQKMSMVESAKFLASSEYLRLIATLVLGYGLSINFTEIMWKSLVKKQYPNPLDYQRFMGNFSSAVGLSTCIVIFVGVHLIRLLGWRVGACATPALMALLAAPFFACILMGLEGSPTRLSLAVMLGTAQSLVSKTSKYALFDPVRVNFIIVCLRFPSLNLFYSMHCLTRPHKWLTSRWMMNQKWKGRLQSTFLVHVLEKAVDLFSNRALCCILETLYLPHQQLVSYFTQSFGDGLPPPIASAAFSLPHKMNWRLKRRSRLNVRRSNCSTHVPGYLTVDCWRWDGWFDHSSNNERSSSSIEGAREVPQ